MKHTIPCTMDSITAPGEDAWIITLDHAALPNAIILLTALRLGRLSQIKLTDRSQTALLRPSSLTLQIPPFPSTPPDWMPSVPCW